MMSLLGTKLWALKGNNVAFPNCRENQVNGNSTRTKKLKLQKWLPGGRGGGEFKNKYPSIFSLQMQAVLYILPQIVKL